MQLQATDDDFLYFAPDTSYEHTWAFAWAHGDKGYRRDREFRFWIKRGDYYGALRVECGAFSKEDLRLLVTFSLNKHSGDRNLQPILPDWTFEDAAIRK